MSTEKRNVYWLAEPVGVVGTSEQVEHEKVAGRVTLTWYADRKEWKNFFATTKAVYGPPVNGIAPLFSADGRTLLTKKTQTMTRWAENLQSVLNQPCTVSNAAIDRLPEEEINTELDLPPSLNETIRAVKQLSSGNAPGSDAIPAEIYKHDRTN
ncbi:unnamed protein product [Schistocephalus solidus]|uniref:Uncharacterized protein n=1 Tax=Schistocephalus solidus TaxID=70667 RepID=A0A183SPJ5_SCHSO|nr:unnamed protein product [Schistocephalus solidus]